MGAHNTVTATLEAEHFTERIKNGLTQLGSCFVTELTFHCSLQPHCILIGPGTHSDPSVYLLSCFSHSSCIKDEGYQADSHCSMGHCHMLRGSKESGSSVCLLWSLNYGRPSIAFELHGFSSQCWRSLLHLPSTLIIYATQGLRQLRAIHSRSPLTREERQ